MSKLLTPKAKAAHVGHQTMHVKRKQAGKVRLPSPWAFLTLQQAHEALDQAYRFATWCARHDGEDTAHFTSDELSQIFIGELHQAFADEVKVRAVQSGLPGDLAIFQCVERNAAMVDPAWRPQYPQFGEVK